MILYRITQSQGENIMNAKKIIAFLIGTTALIAVVVSLSFAQFRSTTTQSNKGAGVIYSEHAYLENGALYQSRPGDPDEMVNRKKIVAEGSERILDQKNGKMLFAKANEKASKLPSEGPEWPNLWITDTASGTARKIYDGISTADISPAGDTIAVSTSRSELHLITSEGKFIKKIGIHGTEPVFSHDGKFLAYLKLNDGIVEMGDDMAQGLAVYNLETNQDTLIVKTVRSVKNTAGFNFTIVENPYGIGHWSQDSKTVYFISEFNPFKEGENALWSVRVDGTHLRQLTNTNDPGTEGSMFYSGQLWSTDGLIVISDIGFEEMVITAYYFNKNGDFVGKKKLADGFSPQWLTQDTLITYRTPDKRWAVLDITQ